MALSVFSVLVTDHRSGFAALPSALPSGHSASEPSIDRRSRMLRSSSSPSTPPPLHRREAKHADLIVAPTPSSSKILQASQGQSTFSVEYHAFGDNTEHDFVVRVECQSNIVCVNAAVGTNFYEYHVSLRNGVGHNIQANVVNPNYVVTTGRVDVTVTGAGLTQTSWQTVQLTPKQQIATYTSSVASVATSLPVTVAANTPTTQTIRVTNTGTGATAYNLSATCAWNNANVIPCSVDRPQTGSLVPAGWAGITFEDVQVSMTTGAPGQGAITLYASAVQNSQQVGQGGVTFVTPPTITVMPKNGSQTIVAGSSSVVPFQIGYAGQGSATLSLSAFGCTLPLTCQSTPQLPQGGPAGSLVVSNGSAATVHVPISLAAGATTGGTVRLSASGSGGLYDEGSVVVTPTPTSAAVSVTPKGGSRAVAPGKPDTLAFTVANLTSTPSAYTLSVAGCGVRAVAACSATPTSLPTIGANASALVRVPYTGGTLLGDTATVTLTATNATGSSDAGKNTVTVASPLVVVDAVNPGVTVARDQCLRIGIAAGVDYACGELQLAHALPAVTTRGIWRSPTLVYSSNQANPVANLAVDVTVPATLASLPDEVRLTLKVNGATVVTRTDAGTHWSSPGQTRRVGMGFWAGPWYPTGVYAVEVQAQFGSQTNALTAAGQGELVIVNRLNSPFGAGWWLAGYEQLIPVAPVGVSVNQATRLLWVGGDGSARVYQRDSSAVDALVAAAYTRPDTLMRVTTGFYAGVGYYERLLPNGARVLFDPQGHHVQTTTAKGDTTAFYYNGKDWPEVMTVPAGAGSATQPDLHYRFFYGATGTPNANRLYAVWSGLTPTFSPLRRMDLVNEDGVVRSITDPDGRSVQFAVAGGIALTAGRVTERTGKGGARWQFAYGGNSGLVEASIADASLPTAVTHRFTSPLMKPGIWGGMRDPIPAESVYTVYDGPRAKSETADGLDDSTKFWHDRFGAVRRLRNARGDSTVVTYGDVRFPGLATAVRDLSGFERHFGYDPSGRMLVDSAMNPMPNVPSAVTQYQWHPKWRLPTQVTSPEGVITSFGYSDTTGNRLWQQSGLAMSGGVERRAADRVEFAYYGPETADSVRHLIRRITYPTVAGSPAATESFTYSARGNVHVATSNSDGNPVAETHYARDAIGRAVADSVLIARVPGLTWQATLRTPDKMDRDSITVAIGPALNGVAEQRVTIATLRDAEGRPTSVSRAQSPDPQPPSTTALGALVTRWEYDALNRVTAEVAPDSTPSNPNDNPRERRHYDPAGNVDSVWTRRGDLLVMRYDALNRLATRASPAFHYDTVRVGIAKRDSAYQDEPPYPLCPSAPGACGGYTIPADVEGFTYDAMGRIATARNAYARVVRTYFQNGLLSSEEQRIRRVDGSGPDSGFARHPYTLTYTYDNDGRRRTLTLPDSLTPVPGASVGYTYDNAARGDLKSVTDPLGATFDFVYSDRGELAELGFPGNLREWWHYDALGQAVRDSLVNRGTVGGFRPGVRVLRNVERRYADLRGKLTYSADAVLRKTTRSMTYTGLGHTLTALTSEEQPTGGALETFTSTETLGHDALGNRTRSDVNAVWRINGTTVNGRSNQRLGLLELGTGRLLREPDGSSETRLTYNRNGDAEVTAMAGDLATLPAEDRLSYFAPDGRVRLSERRSLSGIQGGGTRPVRRVFEEYWYDALGRRVLVRTRRDCAASYRAAAPLIAAEGQVLCELATVRRTVWDGTEELGEIQMPDSARGDLRENDTAPVRLRLRNFDNSTADPNPFFGRVIYTHGAGIDRPLTFTRVNHVTGAADTLNAVVAPAVSWAPHWDDREIPPSGTFASGAQAGNVACSVSPCMPAPGLPIGWFAYDFAQLGERLAWYGTLIDAKRDAAGTHYRRNRAYDPQTGRFTQEDPIGLAGGINLYGYAGGDPVNQSDPFGLCPPCTGAEVLLPGLGGAAAGAAAGTALAAARASTNTALANAIDGAIDWAQDKLVIKFVTYTRTNAVTGQVYSGRTSGFGDPQSIVNARAASHPGRLAGFGPPQVDQVGTGLLSYDAIRGREQQLIDFNGGARSDGGTSANLIRGVSKSNDNGYIRWMASNALFGPLAPYTGRP